MFNEEEAQSMHQQWSDMGRSMVEFTAELILKGIGVDVKKRRTTMEANNENNLTNLVKQQCTETYVHVENGTGYTNQEVQVIHG